MEVLRECGECMEFSGEYERMISKLLVLGRRYHMWPVHRLKMLVLVHLVRKSNLARSITTSNYKYFCHC